LLNPADRKIDDRKMSDFSHLKQDFIANFPESV